MVFCSVYLEEEGVYSVCLYVFIIIIVIYEIIHLGFQTFIAMV